MMSFRLSKFIRTRKKRSKRLLIAGYRIVEINQGQDNDPPMLHERQDTSLKEITNPVRPKALRLFMAIPFVGLFIALAISLGILFIKARLNGM